MQSRNKTVVKVVVQNLIIIGREANGDDKPASAGKLKRVLVDIALVFGPILVSEVQKWMSNFNIN